MLTCARASRIVSAPMRSIDAGTSNGGSSVRVAVTTTGARRGPARRPARPAPGQAHRPRGEQRVNANASDAARSLDRRRAGASACFDMATGYGGSACTGMARTASRRRASGVFPRERRERRAHHRRAAPARGRAVDAAKIPSQRRRREHGSKQRGNAARWSLVTGGMGGLGETIATKMVDAGYKVVVTYSPGNTKHKEWVAGMKEQRLRHPRRAVRRRRHRLVRRAPSARCRARSGAIDILVNNAGITRDMTFKKMDKVNWDAVMRTNLDSLFNMTKQVADGMVERNWGRVINVSSVNGSKGAFGQTNYSAAKAGVHGFTKALALEVAKKGVTVNTISPGYIGTKMVTAIPEGDPRHQDPAADPGRPARQARGSRRPDHLPRLRRGGVPDRRQHRHQRRPAHAMTPRRRRQQQGVSHDQGRNRPGRADHDVRGGERQAGRSAAQGASARRRCARCRAAS